MPSEWYTVSAAVLDEMIEHIESAAVDRENVYLGSHRPLETVIGDGDMPDLYHRLVNMREATSGN